MIVKTRVSNCHPMKRRESKLGGLSICQSIYPVELHYQATYCGGGERRERRISVRRVSVFLMDLKEGESEGRGLNGEKGGCEWGIGVE